MRTENKQIQLRRKRRRKNKGIMGYFCLFISVFAIALFGLSFFVKSYSPDVDVSIGNNDSLTLSETDMNVEIKSVDERLKWIQMEDEMPSVAIREAKESTEKIVKEKNEKKNSVVVNESVTNKIIDLPTNQEPIFKKEEVIPKPQMSDLITQAVPQVKEVPSPQVSDFRTSVPVIPAPIPSLTKVYLGAFSTVDEAMSVQQKIATDIPESMPFIKSKDGSYIVQLGSFSNKAVADAFILKVKEKGYNPKTINQN